MLFVCVCVQCEGHVVADRLQRTHDDIGVVFLSQQWRKDFIWCKLSLRFLDEVGLRMAGAQAALVEVL